jgi:hypothetical protein
MGGNRLRLSLCDHPRKMGRLNAYLESIPDRGFKPVEIPEIAKVANFVLEKIYAADPDQYNALLKSIGEPARIE